jgi:hypothetical protein
MTVVNPAATLPLHLIQAMLSLSAMHHMDMSVMTVAVMLVVYTTTLLTSLTSFSFRNNLWITKDFGVIFPSKFMRCM